MHNLWMAMTGASVGHHEEVPGVSPEASSVGHEPDRFDARTIIGVPIVVAITLVVTYLIVQGAFAFVNSKSPAQRDLPEFNDRANRIGTTDGVPVVDKSGERQSAVPEPNLEFTRIVERTRKDGSGNDVTDPPFLRSFKPAPAGNSPEIYPEDLRADRFIDPTTQRTLTDPTWVVKDKVAAISIDQAIELMTHDDKFKLKTSDKPVAAPAGTIGKARLSTGGTTPPTPAADAKKDKDDGHKR
jgi:hypothetical protein